MSTAKLNPPGTAVGVCDVECGGPRQSPSTRLSSLRWSVFWTTLGTVVSAGGRWAMWIVLAKLATPEVVGEFALALAIASPVTLLGRFALMPVVATDTRGQFRFRDYQAIQLLTVPASIVILAALAGGGYATGQLTGIVAWTVLVVGCAKLVEAVASVWYGLMQRYERMARMAVSMVLKGIGGVAAVTVAYTATESIVWTTAAMGACWLLILLLYDVPFIASLLRDQHADEAGYRPSARTLARVAWVCLPVGATSVLKEINANIPRYFVNVFWGTALMGYFSALAAMTNGLGVLFRSVAQAVTPRMARYYGQRPRAYLGLVTRMLVYSGGLGLAAVLVTAGFGRQLLPIVYKADYARYVPVLVVLMATVTFMMGAASLRAAMLASRRMRLLVLQVVLATTVLLVACAVLVPRYGLWGAAWATLIAAVLELAAGAGVVTHALRKRSADGHTAVVVDGDLARAAEEE